MALGEREQGLRPLGRKGMESRGCPEGKREPAGRGPEHEAEAVRPQGESGDRMCKEPWKQANRPLGQALLYMPGQGWSSTSDRCSDLKIPIPTPEPHQFPQLFCASIPGEKSPCFGSER